MQPFELIAHILEEQAILLRIGLQSTLQQSQDVLHLKYKEVIGGFSCIMLFREPTVGYFNLT